MSKIYRLVGCKSYHTLTKGFVEGKEYSEDEVGDLIDATDDEGAPYFEEVGSDEVGEPATRKIQIGRGAKGNKQPKADAEGTSDEGDSSTVTV